MRRLYLVALLALLLPTLALAQNCIWGSFDASRINYSAGPLTGSAHTQLRDIIVANGGTVGAATPLLTAAYLADMDVFYTSLLSTNTGVLSAAEQTALQNWIAGGGTLIVTADIFPLPAYESFTAFYGVTQYRDLRNSQTGNVVAAHPITAGVTTYRYVTESTFVYGPDALLLGNNGLGDDFMIVLESGTGFPHAGRILVIGDHNMFTISYINNNDNVRLANNFALWACAGPTPVEPTTWGKVKASFQDAQR
jgi:hypothetical protein